MSQLCRRTCLIIKILSALVFVLQSFKVSAVYSWYTHTPPEVFKL